MCWDWCRWEHGHTCCYGCRCEHREVHAQRKLGTRCRPMCCTTVPTASLPSAHSVSLQDQILQTEQVPKCHSSDNLIHSSLPYPLPLLTHFSTSQLFCSRCLALQPEERATSYLPSCTCPRPLDLLQHSMSSCIGRASFSSQTDRGTEK
jgi:hypothetical protein